MPVTVVTGPPCAGKTTWTLTHAPSGAIIVDLDRIAQALTTPGAHSHNHGRILTGVAARARAAAITEALRVADRVDVYIIHTMPSPDALTRYHAAGARITTVDPGRDVVEQRAHEQRTKHALAAISRWYATQPRSSAGPKADGQASRPW